MKWKCLGCGKEENKSPSRADRKRCWPCRVLAYKGEGNPNWRNAAEKTCTHCEEKFSSYNKDRKFCSHKCYQASKPLAMPKRQMVLQLVKPPREPRPRVSKIVERKCVYCGSIFNAFPSSSQKYCSYPCHLDNGGGVRAGLAAIKARMKYGAKKDANHGEIVDALKAHGVSVIDMSHVGQGFPDLIVGFCGETLLMEIKNPKSAYGRRGLNKNQSKWRDGWTGGPYAVVSSVDGAIAAVNALRAEPLKVVS